MDETLVSHWIRPEIHQLSAYHVADADGLIKLDAMENPYTWPDELRQQWQRELAGLDVNRYPDPQAKALAAALRQSMSIADDMGIMLGNGSDEIIQIIAMAMSGPGRVLMSVDPGFVMYRMIAGFCGMRYVGVPLNASDFSLDLAAMLQAIEETQPAVIFLAYPNNPTGNLFAKDDILKIINAAPGLVVIDEAYAPFTDESYIANLGQYENLVVMRTVSKMGLAGLRLGLLAGPKAWLNEFDKVRLPYNINVLTQVSVRLALENQAIFDHQTEQIRQSRSALSKALSQIDGFEVFPSEANFLLIRVEPGRADELFLALKDLGVLIKSMHHAHPLLTDCLRITVGTDQENKQLLAALEQALYKE